jgi:hypothetical protein
MSQFRRLFSPVKIGRREAKNCIVSTPHGAAFARRAGSLTAASATTREGEGRLRRRDDVRLVQHPPTSVNDWGEVNNWDDSIIPQFRG